MKFNKTTMSLALTAAMFGSVAMTQQAFAVPDIGSMRKAIDDVGIVQTSIGIDSFSPAQVQDMIEKTLQHGTYVSPNGLGQALIYPYYTVRGGFKTTINVFNSSDTHAVAVKVRFREFQNSRDVLDFNLILSPNDKWYGVVQEDAIKGAVLVTNDESCTVPKILGLQAPFEDASYKDAYKDAGDSGRERLKSGYVEIIPMGWSVNGALDAIVDGDPKNSAAAALHEQPSGKPYDCSAVEEAFKIRNPTLPFPGAGGATNGAPDIDTEVIGGAGLNAGVRAWEPIPKGSNPLFGEYGIFNSEGGIAGGSNAVALADWMSDTTLFTAQKPPFFLEPTLATAAGVWDTTLLFETDLALTSSTVINEWANNKTNGAHTDWVVTFPTKSFHVDKSDALVPGVDLDGDGNLAENSIQAGSSIYRYVRTGLATGPFPGTTPMAPFVNNFEGGKSTIDLTVAENLYNNEEGKPGAGGVSFSPGTATGSPQFLYEANLITFGGGEVLSSGKMANGDTVAVRIDPVNDIAEGRKHGMLKLGLPGSVVNTVILANGDLAVQTTVTTTTKGLPVVGFAVKERNQGDSSKSYGQLFDHKWISESETTATRP